jgi:hypothetical protein
MLMMRQKDGQQPSARQRGSGESGASAMLRVI